MLVLNLLCKDHKMLGRRKYLLHEKAFLPWMLNDKPVTCFWSELIDWQSNGVILFSAWKIEDCNHLRNFWTNDKCFSLWKMSGYLYVICHQLEKGHENTVIRFTKLWWRCGKVQTGAMVRSVCLLVLWQPSFLFLIKKREFVFNPCLHTMLQLQGCSK